MPSIDAVATTVLSDETERSASSASCFQLDSQAGRALTDALGPALNQIDYVILVPPTQAGFSSLDISWLDAHRLKPDITLSTITGLGSAAGAAALSQAHHYAVAHPSARILIVAANDGGEAGHAAACALVTGDRIDRTGPEIIATQSNLYPDPPLAENTPVMSPEEQLRTQPHLARLIAENSVAELDVFLKQNGLTRDDISQYLYHLPDAALLDALCDAYEVDSDVLRYSRETMRTHGNLGSVSVLIALADYLQRKEKRGDDYAVISAFGTGFTSESLLIRG